MSNMQISENNLHVRVAINMCARAVEQMWPLLLRQAARMQIYAKLGFTSRSAPRLIKLILYLVCWAHHATQQMKLSAYTTGTVRLSGGGKT